MIIELHAIQSFAPANLNRDDTGAPKECVFGDVRRARVSSQAWKRAIRMRFRESAEGIPVGTRTKRAHEAIVERLLTAEPGLSPDQAHHRAAVVLEAEPLTLSLVRPNDNGEVRTGQLLFFREADLDTLAEVAREHASALDSLSCSLTPVDGGDGGATKKGSKKTKLPKDATDRVKTAMTTAGDALDVALFGRMVAELPDGNVDAACQVAHAIGTHRLASEYDYYTAVDDRKPEDNEGADMIGTVQFNASCLYRYAVLDTERLAENLGATADAEAVTTATRTFAEAFVQAIPTGKQNTFAARNLPSAVLAVSRRSGAWNLANAFLSPVDGRADGGLATASTRRMLDEFETLMQMYGRSEDEIRSVLLARDDASISASVEIVRHVDNLLERVGMAA